MPTGENLVVESVVFGRQFGFLFRQHIQIIRLIQVVFVTSLCLAVVLKLREVVSSQAELFFLASQILHHVSEGGERGYKFHRRAAVPCVAPIQQVDLRTVPGCLFTVFAELVQGVVETAERQPDLVLDGYRLPAFLEPVLHVPEEIRIVQSFPDRGVIG